VERNDPLESHVSSRAHENKCGENSMFPTHGSIHSLGHLRTQPCSPSVDLCIIHALLELARTLEIPRTFPIINNKSYSS